MPELNPSLYTYAGSFTSPFSGAVVSAPKPELNHYADACADSQCTLLSPYHPVSECVYATGPIPAYGDDPGIEPFPGAELLCCDVWLAYPKPGVPSYCPNCKSQFVITG